LLFVVCCLLDLVLVVIDSQFQFTGVL